ncbi:MAG: hypothetical protein IKD99_05305 [Erysipelotrichaceae bacterium]|nr:hypothetical protein [Erysipelotrichaceae bacterium]
MPIVRNLKLGYTSIVIVRPDTQQPGIAAISKKTGEAVLTVNTNNELYPAEAFKEAMELTRGLPFRKRGAVRVTREMFAEPEPATEPVEIVFDEVAYRRVVDKYTDKTGIFSFDLMNKDFIGFAKRSSIVRNMVSDGKKASDISNYILRNKIRNVAGDLDMPDAAVDMIIEKLEEVSPKGAYKELNSEIRKMLARNKKN